MNHEALTRLGLTELDGATIEGTTIHDPMDENVGSINNVHGAGAAMAVMVDVGTFLGMCGKTVAIPVSALTFKQNEEGEIHATSSWTKEQINALPEHEHM